MASVEPTTPSPDEPAAADDRGYDAPAPLWLIHGGIIVAFALFLSMVALLYVRWANSKEPNTTLILYGDQRFDGIEVSVVGAKLDAPVVDRFTQANDYQVRFPLPGGTYLIRMSKDGIPLVQDTPISMREGVGAAYNLTRAVRLPDNLASTTRPTTRP